MLLACCCVHLQTKAGKAAKSTVAEEIADNLSLMLQRFERITGDKPVLVMDNARIQSCLPAGCINSDHGDVELPPQQRVKLPPHSPDMNQPVEQSVGAVKGDVIGQEAEYVQKTSKPITAAELARKFGIRVYTIGVGSMGDALTPVSRRSDGQYVFGLARVEIDEALLQQIASMTSGRYFRATSEESLEKIYREIDRLEKTEIDVTTLKRYSEAFRPLTWLALLLLLLEFALRQTWLRNVGE